MGLNRSGENKKTRKECLGGQLAFLISNFFKIQESSYKIIAKTTMDIFNIFWLRVSR